MVLKKLNKSFEEILLSEIEFPHVDEEFLTTRDKLLLKGNTDNPMFNLSRRFAEAEIIVIAAPYWDLSFPASLKQYFEQINVVGITFKYTDDGLPVGLCKARKLIVVTTSGGTNMPQEYGFGYIKALARSFYGISDVKLVAAEGFDIDGADTEDILRTVKEDVDNIL